MTPFSSTTHPDRYLTAIENLSRKIDFDFCDSKGGTGYVIFGTHKILERRVAVKFYDCVPNVSAEPRQLARFDHPNILAVDDAEAVDETTAFFVTPYCDGGDLDDYLQSKSLSTNTAVDAVMSIATGVSYLHGEGYIHRDLKPQNIFILDGNKPVIGDFGSVVAQDCKGSSISLTKHSLLYRPPEDISGNTFYREGDIYQLGIILFQLLGGYLPYNETHWLNRKEGEEYKNLSAPDNQLFANSILEKKILKNKLLDFSTLPPWTSSKLQRVIRRCTNTDYQQRFDSVSDFRIALHNLKPELRDWKREGDWAICSGTKTQYRAYLGENSRVQKRFKSDWRNVNGFEGDTAEDAVIFISGTIS